MLPEIAFRPVQPDECCQVVALHRRVFSPEQVARTIYASSRVDLYLANLPAFSQLQREHMLWGAWSGKCLVGYAHFRALSESWHLNYIAVSPECTGQGIGQALWARGIEMGQRMGYDLISLDVDRENQRALDWYRRLGLRTVETVWTYEKDIERPTAPNREAGPVRLLDWEQAEAWQLAYGFSEFRLVYRERIWTVGRLGKRYFRVKRKIPATLEGVLVEIDPVRRLLIESSKPIQGMDLKEVGVSLRMQGDSVVNTETGSSTWC